MQTIESDVLPVVSPSPAAAKAVGAAGALVTRGTKAAGTWAFDTAQESAALLADLMGPAVFMAYAMMAWSLTNDLGWTSSFLFTAGPLSNWLVWLGIAVLMSVTANVLKRHTHTGTNHR